MSLAADDLATYASDIARAFGGGLSFVPPADARTRMAIRGRLVELLAEARPHPDGPSLAEALSVLLDDVGRGSFDRASAARNFAELRALFEQAAFRRTKRAERGRLFAQLVVLFELEPVLGVTRVASSDAEEHLKQVRRRLRE